ncbi:MAG: hypothetical protein K2V38_11935, partial [Gemmataceae bacterium]|nr:hypothetical protein [Gemmataceae bacterium]
MIRFNCPNCNRFYELPPALAFLPLVCKGCGQRLTPPAPEAVPPAPEPAPALTPLPKAPRLATPVAPPGKVEP